MVGTQAVLAPDSSLSAFTDIAGVRAALVTREDGVSVRCLHESCAFSMQRLGAVVAQDELSNVVTYFTLLVIVVLLLSLLALRFRRGFFLLLLFIHPVVLLITGDGPRHYWRLALTTVEKRM